jgi:hypothetical protein
VADVEAIHGHQGNTKVVMGAPPAEKKPRKKKKQESES